MWLDHITSSCLILDNTSTDIPRFATSQLIRRWRAGISACSEANQRERVRNFNASKPATLHPLPGDNSCVEPPDPIPNSEVKRARADGSVHLACESRSSPGSLFKTPSLGWGFFFARRKCFKAVELGGAVNASRLTGPPRQSVEPKS